MEKKLRESSVHIMTAQFKLMPADPALTATQARQLAALREKFAAFPALGTELVPQNSMLREFIGK